MRLVQVAATAQRSASAGLSGALGEAPVDTEGGEEWYRSLPASRLPFLAVMPNAEVRPRVQFSSLFMAQVKQRW